MENQQIQRSISLEKKALESQHRHSNQNSKQYVENWKREVLRDKTMNKILSKNYDQKQFILDLVKNNSISELTQIHQNMNTVKQNLVVSLDSTLQNNYSELISDMEKIKDVDVNIEECRDQINAVNKNVNSTLKDFSEKYEILEQKIPLLKNSYKAIALTQNSLKLVQNLKQLKYKVGNKFEVVDFVKTSQILNEITNLCKQVDFTGLSFFEQNKEFIKQAEEATTLKTEKKFDEALQSKNQIEISNSIQIFYNLGKLAETLQKKANLYLKNTRTIWKNVMTKEYQSSKIMNAMNQEIKQAIKNMNSNSLQIWLLNQAIKTSRDPKSLENYDQFLKGKNLLNLFDLFWKKQIQIVKQSLQNFKDNKEKYDKNWKCMVLSYPKILKGFEEFVNNFHEQVIQFPDHLHSYGIPNLKEQMLDSVEILRELYFTTLNETLMQNSKNLLQSIAVFDKNNVKQYYGKVNTQLQIFLQKLEFEIIENIQTEEIFEIVYDKILDIIQNMVNSIQQQFLKNKQNFISNILLMLMNVFTILKHDIFTNILDNPYNYKMDESKVQQTLEILNKFIMEILQILEEKVLTKIKIGILTEKIIKKNNNIQQNLSVLQDLDQYLSQIRPNQLQYECDLFNINDEIWMLWENILLESLSAFALISLWQFETNIGPFQQKNLKQNKQQGENNGNLSVLDMKQDLVSKQIEMFTNIIDKLGHKNTKSMKMLVFIHKLFIIDMQSSQQLLERDIDFQEISGIVYYRFALKFGNQVGKNIINNQDELCQILNDEFNKDKLLLNDIALGKVQEYIQKIDTNALNNQTQEIYKFLSKSLQEKMITQNNDTVVNLQKNQDTIQEIQVKDSSNNLQQQNQENQENNSNLQDIISFDVKKEDQNEIQGSSNQIEVQIQNKDISKEQISILDQNIGSNLNQEQNVQNNSHNIQNEEQELCQQEEQVQEQDQQQKQIAEEEGYEKNEDTQNINEQLNQKDNNNQQEIENQNNNENGNSEIIQDQQN